MKKPIWIVLATATLFWASLPAFGNILTFRIGFFSPQAKSDLWQIEFDQMSFSKSNFQSTAYGFDYELVVSKNFSLTVGLDSYQKSKMGYYLDFQGIDLMSEGFFAVPISYGGDYDLFHAFRVSITPFQAGFKFTPLGRRTKFIPYCSAGASVFLWSVDLEGDMIDFTDEWILTDPVYGETEAWGVQSILARESNRLSLGWYCAAGVQMAVGNRITLQAEIKYFSGRGDMSEFFLDFEPFDLSSLFVSLGLNYWF